MELNISYEKLTKLLLTERYCNNNQIRTLENLPNTYFNCHNNQITKLENLPDNIITLYCYNNQIKFLENLPDTLQKLYCGNNQITKLENLPNGISELYCGGNQITKLENLPNGLIYFNYYGNPIKFIDNLDLKRFNKGTFDLKLYQTFKRLQRRIRWRSRRKNKAIRIIQRGCYNWLFKPYTKDGKMGILPRLTLRELQDQGFVH